MSTTDANTISQTDAAPDEHDSGHAEHGLSDASAVKIFIFLVVVTGAEVALSYMIDSLGPLFLPILLTLMIVKFFTVVLYFMHLKYDSRFFSLFFYVGIALALMVYLGTLFSFRFF